MIKAIVFDLGNVVINISIDRIFAYWAAGLGLPAGEIASRFVFDEAYENFERGRISAPDYIKHIADKYGIVLTETLFTDGWNSIFGGVIPGVGPLLRGLKTGYRLAALSNTNEIHAEYFKALYKDTLAFFEQIFVSNEIGARKPDARAFQAVLDYLKLAPGEILFLDDNPAFTAKAGAIGMRTVLVSSFEATVNGLKEAGVKLPKDFITGKRAHDKTKISM
ncbi:MAG: HAD family hydrolase [Bacillota bacterium]